MPAGHPSRTNGLGRYRDMVREQWNATQGLWKQTLSKTCQTARNLRPSGYDVFAHQCDQSFFTRTPRFTALTTERVRTH